MSNSWDQTADTNTTVRFIDTVLRGPAQVMFQNNPLTGLIFLAAITWGALDADMWEVAVGAVLAVLVSTITAMLLRVDTAGLRQGLYGFNGVLVGCGVPTFIDVDGLVWVYIVVGAATSTVVMLAISNVFSTWGVPALTFPFVLTTWFLVLGAWTFTRVPPVSLGPAKLPAAPEAGADSIDITAELLAETLFRNVAQVFLIDNVVTGVLFVIGLAVCSRWAALFALFGSSVAIATALALGADGTSISSGLFGFSAVLTAIAFGCTFYTPGWQVTAYATLATVFTVVVQGALDASLSPVGIPSFTAPFVFTTWLFLLPKQKFIPLHHQRLAHTPFTKHHHESTTKQEAAS